jgi:NAD(P)-dependent dehydrogenase (short-subunit alcohol dehydrogenase family)
MTRRRAIARIGTAGIDALGNQGVLAAQGKEEPMTVKKLEDPTTKYPKPPFKEQSQAWPGLASKMDPRPDHGEKSYKGSGRLLGRKALITGGDSGMGRAAAIAYAREGADVAINYFPTEQPDADEVIALIKKEGHKAVAIPGDLRDETFCKKLVSDAVEQLGGLDILVCNAGRQQTRASILNVSREYFDATMKTNIYAPFWIIKAAVPHMPSGSVIIGTTSEQATDPSPEIYDYAQRKAATTNYVRSLAKQLGPKGIRVNGVAPGPIWTPLQVSGGATMEKLNNSAAKHRSVVPASLQSLLLFTYSLPVTTPVTRPVKSMAQPEEAGNLSNSGG